MKKYYKFLGELKQLNKESLKQLNKKSLIVHNKYKEFLDEIKQSKAESFISRIELNCLFNLGNDEKLIRQLKEIIR